jgi:hypothetical protein
MTSNIDRTDEANRDPVLYDDALSGEPRDDQSYETEGPGAGTAGGAIGGAAAGAIAGTLIAGPIGTAVGAAVGAVGGAVIGRASEVMDEPGVDSFDPGATTGVGGMATPVGFGAGVNAVSAGVGAGPPTTSSEADPWPDDAEIERRGVEQGPFDNPASYDETAAEVAKDRSILVGDDPGYDAVDTTLGTEERDPVSRISFEDRNDPAVVDDFH